MLIELADWEFQLIRTLIELEKLPNEILSTNKPQTDEYQLKADQIKTKSTSIKH